MYLDYCGIIGPASRVVLLASGKQRRIDTPCRHEVHFWAIQRLYPFSRLDSNQLNIDLPPYRV